MDKIKSNFEYIRFPLIILLLATIIKGAGIVLLNNNFVNFFNIDNEIVFSIAHIMSIFGDIIVSLTPILIALRYLNFKYRNERVSFMFIASYAMFIASTMLLISQDLPQNSYSNYFSIDLTALNLVELNQTFHPVKTGAIGIIISILIVRFSFEITRGRTEYSVFSFIDKDTLATILTIVLTFISGYIFSFAWPYVVAGLFHIFDWIKNDITNPISLFVYGTIERFTNVLGLNTMIKAPFWFSEFGGTWIDQLGNNFTGDVPIWSEQIKSGIFDTGFGRFITPSYIRNIFVYPTIMLGIYRNDTDKYNRKKFLPLLIIMMLISMFTDLSLPIELFMIVMMPMFYVFHVFVSGITYAILQSMSVFLGASFSGFIQTTSVGNLIDLLTYSRYPQLMETIIIIIIVGISLVVIYYFGMKFYYKRLAFGLVNQNRIDYHVDVLLEMVGGVENIKAIDANSLRIHIELKKPQLFNYDKLSEIGIDRAIETKIGFALYYGTASQIIKDEVLYRKHLIE